MRVVISAMCLLAPFGILAQVRTFVTPSGLDTNPCSLTEPCRNFAAAMTAVDDNGEVVALSSGGFGPVIINKPVILTAPQGVYAAIAPTIDAAVEINTVGSVTLRNLVLNSQGAVEGVLATNAGRLTIEDSVIGVMNIGTTTVDRTIATHGGSGFTSFIGTMVITRSTADHNIESVSTNLSGEIWLTDSTIVQNATGIAPSSGFIRSRGNNTVENNGSNGVFNGTFTAK